MDAIKQGIGYKIRAINSTQWIYPIMLGILVVFSAAISVIYSSPFPFFIVLALLLLIPSILFIFSVITPRVLLGIFIVSRLVLDSIHTITYENIIGPISIMKLYSVGVLAFGIFYLIRRKEIRLDWLLILFLLLLATSFATTIYHQTWFAFLEESLKWCYLWLIINLTRLSMNEGDFKRFPLIILLCYSYAILNFFYSLVIGKAKYTSGVTRFIGTYYHQSDFSFIMLTIIPVALYLIMVEKETIKKITYGIIILIAHIGIYSASYRTTWLALVFYWIVFLVFIQHKITVQKKILVSFLLALILGFMMMPGFYVGNQMGERLAPVANLLQEPSRYLETASSESYRAITGKPYVDETEENLLLSGRIGDWKALVIAYQDAPIEEKVLGMGVGMDKDIMAQYKWGRAYDAHNIYVETLVEGGILGLVALLIFFIIIFFKISHRVKQASLARIIAAPIFFSFIIAGFAENALDDIRGFLCLGLYLGIALYCEDPYINKQNIYHDYPR